MTNNLKKIILWVFLAACLHPMILFAQEDPSVPMGPDYDPDGVPIDGGVGILLVAGVTYGLKKIYDNKRKNKEI